MISKIKNLEKELLDAEKALLRAKSQWTFFKKQQYKAWEQSWEYPADKEFTTRSEEWEKRERKNVEDAEQNVRQAQEKLAVINQKIRLLFAAGELGSEHMAFVKRINQEWENESQGEAECQATDRLESVRELIIKIANQMGFAVKTTPVVQKNKRDFLVSISNQHASVLLLLEIEERGPYRTVCHPIQGIYEIPEKPGHQSTLVIRIASLNNMFPPMEKESYRFMCLENLEEVKAGLPGF